MLGQALIRSLAAAGIIVSCSLVLGCKSGGGGGFAFRKNSQTAKNGAGPALGTPSTYATGRKHDPRFESPENVAYHTEEPLSVPLARSNPQRNCPVDGQSLGTGGTPVTTTLKGEPIFVCSQACAKKAQKDPDRYLTKVRRETAARSQ